MRRKSAQPGFWNELTDATEPIFKPPRQARRGGFRLLGEEEFDPFAIVEVGQADPRRRSAGDVEPRPLPKGFVTVDGSCYETPLNMALEAQHIRQWT